ncbi:Na+/H+ antiporter [Syntrophomonas palmitatica]|uniref:Na+/H+ antiporter n=1 Tax=Syntrophomonas palmitatica TaxID=402877 RepID=UPI0006CF436E|nr:Na+/H+ antiporter [Syntrophomonas palmitatica]
MFAVVTGFDFTAFFWLMVIATMVAMIGRYIRVPYALALVITGLIIAPTGILPQIHLEPQILFTIFLPPLLFESAINMRISLLRMNWRSVSIYALLGTTVSALVTGYLAHRFLGLPLEVGLVFGALIAPTDPISVIAIFKQLGVGKRLSLIMEAESLFNDGVAIVLFTLLVAAASGGDLSVITGVKTFFTVVIGGAALGAGIGIVASRLTREFNDHLLEIMLTTIVAFASYLLAEWFHVSGVIAVVSAGLVVGSYGMQTGMSATTRLSVNSFWEYAAFLVNSIVFLLVGFEVSLINFFPKIGIILSGALVVLIGRAISIYGLSPLINRLGGNIPLSWQHVLFWGGLRGAIPMALVLGLGKDFPNRSDLVLLTFGVVLFSLLAQGLSIRPLLKKLSLTGVKNPQSEHGRLASEIMAIEAAQKELLRLKDRKALSVSGYEKISAEYNKRLADLEYSLNLLNEKDDQLNQTQENEAWRMA